MANGSVVQRISREYAEVLRRQHERYCQAANARVSFIDYTRLLAQNNGFKKPVQKRFPLI